MTCRSYPLTAAEHDRWKLEGKTEWPGAVLPLHLLFPEREPAALQAIPTNLYGARDPHTRSHSIQQLSQAREGPPKDPQLLHRRPQPRRAHLGHRMIPATGLESYVDYNQTRPRAAGPIFLRCILRLAWLRSTYPRSHWPRALVLGAQGRASWIKQGNMPAPLNIARLDHTGNQEWQTSGSS